eukprot:9301124-Pyramimonas_sp.AAC.1
MLQVALSALCGLSLALLTTRVAFLSAIRSYGGQASGLLGGSKKSLRGSRPSSAPSSATGVGLSSGLGSLAVSDSLLLPPSSPQSIPSGSPSILLAWPVGALPSACGSRPPSAPVAR